MGIHGDVEAPGPIVILGLHVWRQENNAPAAIGAGGGLLLDCLDFERDLDLVADQNATALEGRIPGDAKILAVDLSRGAEAAHGLAPRVVDGPVVTGVECNLPRDTGHGQVPVDGEGVLALRLDPGADKG